MRRRLTLAIVGLVAAVVVVAGAGTLVVTRASARNQAVSQTLAEARDLAAQAQLYSNVNLSKTRPLLAKADVGVVSLRGDGTVIGPLPAGLSSSDLSSGQLLAGQAVSGSKAGLAFAAVPATIEIYAPVQHRYRSVTVVVALTRQLGNLGPSWAYFTLIGLGAIVVAAAVADRIGRRISRPLVRAVDATARIAKGDMSTPVGVARTDYPELSELAGAINTMAASLERSRQTERQFLLSVSHDLRTPLTSIRGFAEAIADGAAPDTTVAASVIASESRRLERLVRDLLDLARLESSSFSLTLRPTDPGEVVADTAEGFRPMIEKAGLSLTVKVAEDQHLVRADPDRLAQVLANLVENAFNFAAGAVTVWAAEVQGTYVVSVEDDGPGISAEDVGHVFDRHYQSTRVPARRAGSGLGLAIVADLSQAMGVSTRVDSPLGPAGGTRMLLGLHPWEGALPYPASGSSSTVASAVPPSHSRPNRAGGSTSRRT